MKKLIFVCHGSICRSPAAEFIFKKLLKDNDLEAYYSCKSLALTNEELGNDIYPPMKKALDKYDIPYSYHPATRITSKDVEEADMVLYMDDENRRRILEQFTWCDKFVCIAKYINQKEVDDPWYTDAHELIVRQLLQACANLLVELEEDRKKKQN